MATHTNATSETRKGKGHAYDEETLALGFSILNGVEDRNEGVHPSAYGCNPATGVYRSPLPILMDCDPAPFFPSECEDALIAVIDGETDEEDEERQYRSSNSIKVAGETGRVRRTRHKVRGDIVRISTFASPEAEEYRGVAGMKFYRDNTAPRPGGKKRRNRNRNRGRRANQR